MTAIGRPEASEASERVFTHYISRVAGDNIVHVLESQMNQASAWLDGISEELSLHRYAPEKWTIREVINHVSDTERAFGYRALWFARGFSTPLESFDQELSVPEAQANLCPWPRLQDEFRAVRGATVALFRNLPDEAWTRAGVAGGNRITVRALAFLAAGHADHHFAIVRERYLKLNS
jgi:hypothetical protein